MTQVTEQQSETRFEKTVVKMKIKIKASKGHRMELEFELKSHRRENSITRDIDLNNISEFHTFSSSGSIFKSRSHVGGGQMLDEILEHEYTRNNTNLLKLHAIWKRWHLNDLKAGSRNQKGYLDAHYKLHSEEKYEYTKACKHLEGVDLYEDNGYRYGSSWLVEPIPQDVIIEIMALVDDIQKDKSIEVVSLYSGKDFKKV